MEKIYFTTLSRKKKKQITNLLTNKKTITLNQVHGNKILVLRNDRNLASYYKNKLELEYDGVITQQKELYLTIKHADCSPVFLYSNNSEIIGILHCGWRSVKEGIIEEAKKIFQKKFHFKQKIFFSLGPTICQKCYIVGEDLVETFTNIIKKYQLTLDNYFNTKNNNFFFDLKKIIRDIALKNGFYLQKNSRTCPLEHPDYFSHRENKTKERNISFIVKK